MPDHKRLNRLSQENSPYLLQHAHNPVDWYPWGNEALERARLEDKPILLSIGYSACHWCHVMEKESFENEAIARIMNVHFINIKVDREERPDLDSVYMSAVQMMTGRGGWPLTVFLTPDRVPFYGGTYFPPEDRQGMPAFPRILLGVARAYRERREQIGADAASMLRELNRLADFAPEAQALTPAILEAANRNLLSDFDEQNGGFGSAPKFPPSMPMSFLLRHHLRTGERRSLQAVERTLEKMAWGGIYDQLGGGFHRYAVDSRWLVPHFEKMLYDNALLSRIYLDAFLLTGRSLYRRIAEETLDYVLREMTSPEGGFYSSQDADSDGHEGAFFLWTPEEINRVLGKDDGELFCRYFDVTAPGDFEGRSILHIPRPAGDFARLNGVEEEGLAEVVQRGKALLLEQRERRIRPARDEKILTGWNGLMLRSFAEAGCGLGRDDYREAAVRNARFLTSRLYVEGRLRRSYHRGQARLNAYLEDHANLVDGLLSLYEATFESKWLDEAIRLADRTVALFRDEAGGPFYSTSVDHEALIQRPRDHYDNAVPSGNSAAAHAFVRLWRLTGEEAWEERARSLLQPMASAMAGHPLGFGNLLCALDFYLGPAREIAIVGDAQDPATFDLVRVVFGRYLPNKVVACGNRGVALLEGKDQVAGLPTAYVCRDRVCEKPVNNRGELARLLSGE